MIVQSGDKVVNIFEKASRQALRFQTNKGEITVEQLWKLPLTGSADSFNLDDLAKLVHKEIKESQKFSFVSEKANPVDTDNELRLSILKHIIRVKKDWKNEKSEALRKQKLRKQLLDVLAEKEAESLQSLTPEQIKQKLDELG
jgi:hypothetical protein